MSAIFIPFSKLCWALGLSVSLLGDLSLALHLSVFCGTYVGHWFCLFVGWVTYVWHCICLLFVVLMWAIGFVCFLVG